ncbi:glycerophosphocholine phosphodiesterase GPCPD1-like isoform X2 [Mya arenaria]|uniref:glycerophosphocholine phosphodiesterase GPCPD1-like isoform X2 n=1 Tax=Mya arenaria TaxID=6604 RepID=UPI0022E729A3|nr:glycerophosphocholine phosphodiesterase GPCPD1-like isoform X2 [Mya arenaria]
MLKSVTYEVLFRVRIKTEPGEVVCITGDCSELGNWNLYKGPRLRRETQCKAAPESVAQGACKNGQNGDVWAKKITFHGSINTHYRYYVARVYHDDDEDSVLVMRWETNIKPRKFSITEAMSICEPPLEDIAVFGEYDGHCHITNGWLTDQAQINIHLHGSPIKIWNAKLRDQQLSIKCTPLDHKYRDEHMNDEGETLPEAAQAIVSVVKLEHGQSKARCQGEYGIMYTQGSNISFKIQTLEPENTGLQLDFYMHQTEPSPSNRGTSPIPASTSPVSNDPSSIILTQEGAIPTVKHIGYSFILPLEVHSSTDRRTVPITSLKHHPLGQITFDYLLIKPLIGAQFSLEVTYQNYWKAREPLDIGHRGMGMSYSNKCKMLAATRENTIKSLQDAANHGADFVELDVHLTKDKQAIVYHDFKVQIAYRKKRQGELEILQVPVKDLKLSELQHMKFVHREEELHDEDTDPEDLQPFPTVARCLQAVDLHTGFNIEIKYPQWLENHNAHEQENYYDLNEFIDVILRVIFENHGGRRIVFTSFDCNSCIIYFWKQRRETSNYSFPMLYLQSTMIIWTMEIT